MKNEHNPQKHEHQKGEATANRTTDFYCLTKEGTAVWFLVLYLGNSKRTPRAKFSPYRGPYSVTISNVIGFALCVTQPSYQSTCSAEPLEYVDSPPCERGSLDADYDKDT